MRLGKLRDSSIDARRDSRKARLLRLASEVPVEGDTAAVDRPDEGSATATTLFVRVGVGLDQEDDLARAALDWAERLATGGLLHLTADRRTAGGSGDMGADRLLLWLRNAGFAPLSVRERGSFRLVVATKRHDWSALARRNLSDPAFLELLYRDVLGRPIDPSGLENYLGELASGIGRDRLLRNFHLSGERAARMRAQG